MSDLRSLMGYSKGSPWENAPYNLIKTSDGRITMANTKKKLKAYDAKTGKFLSDLEPGKEYKFNVKNILEIPSYQKGGPKYIPPVYSEKSLAPTAESLIKKDGLRQPRVLFLADRNILATQAYNDFNAFAEFEDNALKRIKPEEIKKTGKVPTNGSIFFTIFQTFMSGKDSDGKSTPYFGEYPRDYFDFIIIVLPFKTIIKSIV